MGCTRPDLKTSFCEGPVRTMGRISTKILSEVEKRKNVAAYKLKTKVCCSLRNKEPNSYISMKSLACTVQTKGPAIL